MPMPVDFLPMRLDPKDIIMRSMFDDCERSILPPVASTPCSSPAQDLGATSASIDDLVTAARELRDCCIGFQLNPMVTVIESEDICRVVPKGMALIVRGGIIIIGTGE